ncbi:MAG: gluconokinase, GntK/IdnK-type [Glaciecola sp.]
MKREAMWVKAMSNAQQSINSPCSKPNASAFLWNQHMMLNVNCRGYLIAQFMQPEPSKYAFAPNIEAKTFMQPEHPYFAHHPGRFFYIKDEASKTVFSVPFAPCNEALDKFKFTATPKQVIWQIEHLGFAIDLCLQLANDAPFEYWQISLADLTGQNRRVSVYSYFTLGYMSWMNQTANYYPDEDSIVAQYVTPYQKLSDYPKLKDTAQCTFLTSSHKPDSWCANQVSFEGVKGLHSPAGIQTVSLNNKPAFYETPVAIMQHRMKLSPKHQRRQFVFGPCHRSAEMASIRKKHVSLCEKAFSSTLAEHAPLAYENFQLQSRDAKFDDFINHWLPRQVYYHGDVNRLTTDPQTRNYLQDNIGMCFLRPSSARECLLRSLEQQFASGEMPDGILIHPEAELKYINQIPHSDHCIWLPLLLEVYLDQTNDTSVLHQMLAFQDSSEEKSLIEHIELALHWVLSKRDHRGLCFIEQGDWCDPMNMVGPKGKGVSSWLTLATATAIKVWIRLVNDYKVDVPKSDFAHSLRELQQAVIQHCWDGNWFARGITDDNELFGISSDREGRIYLNPQSWALLAGIDSDEYKSKMLMSVDQHLQTPFGNQMLAPCYTQMDERIGRVTQKFPGSAENGSVYNHAFAFWIYAMFTSGEADKGLLNLKEMLSAMHSEQAGQLPIYLPNYFRGAYTQFPETAGRSSHLFNTGTAAWIYRIVIEQLFGLRGCGKDLWLQPQIPSSMGNCDIRYRFRNADIHLKIEFGNTLTPKLEINGRMAKDLRIENVKEGEQYTLKLKLPNDKQKCHAKLILVCGVSGAGKSALGQALAEKLGAVFIEGDALHAKEAIAKMAEGVALSEDDRAPWLARLQLTAAQKLAHGYDTVVSFSGLKAEHRALLMSINVNTKLVMLAPSESILQERLLSRKGHFFSPHLLASQLASLEMPSPSENTLVIDGGQQDNVQQLLHQMHDFIAKQTPNDE